MTETGPPYLEEGMRVVTLEPLNVETSLGSHVGVITPARLFYHRNHFAFPQTESAPHPTVDVAGAVDHPWTIQLAHLLSMPRRTVLVTTECAGNGRASFQPPADGEPWKYAAVSTAEWTGVPLRHVLETAGLQPAVVDILFEGADSGHVEAAGATIPYQRSLPLKRALDPDVILAFSWNGSEADDIAHGLPFRLIVPGWYGMASVKWVARIEALTQPFDGFYQVDRYVLPDGRGGVKPLANMRVRSLIADPGQGSTIATSQFPTSFIIRGMAWSGQGPIVRVETSLDAGASWTEATLTSDEERYAWRRWESSLKVVAPGEVTVMSRATDAAGNTQPFEAEWNRLGYANNAVQSIRIQVTQIPVE